MIHRDVGNHSPTDMASHPSRPASSVCSHFLVSVNEMPAAGVGT